MRDSLYPQGYTDISVPEPTEVILVEEPERTGVEPTQRNAGQNAIVIPPPGAEHRAYGSMSTVLEAFYREGVRSASMPLLLANQQQVEERLKQVDAERVAALARIDTLTSEITSLKISLTRVRERLKGGPRIGEQVMTTIGAAALGVGIPASSVPLIALGGVLLIAGWGLAVRSITKAANDIE